jgi:hypothetical protein
MIPLVFGVTSAVLLIAERVLGIRLKSDSKPLQNGHRFHRLDFKYAQARGIRVDGPVAYFYGFRLVDAIKVELNHNNSSDLSWTKLLFWTKLHLNLVRPIEMSRQSK